LAQILSEDLAKSRDKIERLLSTIDELQASDSSAQLSTKPPNVSCAKSANRVCVSSVSSKA